MSINMDSDAPTDYSDFEYQQVAFGVELQDPAGDQSGSSRVEFSQEIPVLGAIGGLNTDEVAELVYMETQASVEPEDETGDQNVGTAVEFRGAVGANLPDADGITGLASDTANDNNIIEVTNAVSADLDLRDVSEDRIFQLFNARSALPFDDTTSGPGGASLDSGVVYEKNWRQLTGRGPVLDSSDDLGISGDLIVGDSVMNIIGNVRLHMVFDTAEVSDAGRAFSVPMDD